MRSILVPVLGAIHILGVSGAQVACDTKRAPISVTKRGNLANITEACISSFCASGGHKGIVTEECGPLLLTISHLNGTDSLVHGGECVGHFQSIISQCVIADKIFGDRIAGGVSDAGHAVFDVSVKGQHGEYEHHTLAARQTKKKQTAAKGKSKTPHEEKGNKVKQPKQQQNQKEKKKPKACPLPGTKQGKAGKTKQTGKTKPTDKKAKPAGKSKSARSIADSTIESLEHVTPELAKRMFRWITGKPPKKSGRGKKSRGRKNQVASNDCRDPWEFYYKETLLYQSAAGHKVLWWRFQSAQGWKSKVPHNSKAWHVIDGMNPNGKLDVIRIKPGFLYVMGNPTGGTVYTDWLGRPNSYYLLVNGGFFKMKSPNKYAAIGPTSASEHQIPLPPEYERYYEMIEGESDTYLYSGPALLKKWTGKGVYFQYNDATASIDGSLSHANEHNERLALVQLHNGDKYVFAYTAKARSDGVKVQGLRDIIYEWFDIWNPKHTKEIFQITNLDGGGSINVVWQGAGQTAIRIAQGSIADEMPTADHDPRRVSNYIALSPFEMTDADLEYEYDDGDVAAQAGPS